MHNIIAQHCRKVKVEIKLLPRWRGVRNDNVIAVCSDKMSIFRWQPPAPRSMLMGLKVEVLWPLRLTSNMVPLNIWAGLSSLSGCRRPRWTSMWPTPGCHKSRGGKYLSTTTFNKEGNKELLVPSSQIPLAIIGESKTRQLPFTMKFQQPTPANNASM